MSRTAASAVVVPDRRPLAGLVVSAAFVLALFLVASWAAWPIYQAPHYLVMLGGTVVAAAAISVAGLVRSWSWLTVLLVTVGAYLLLGVPLAVPSALVSPAAFAGGWLDLVSATVFGWKELVTIRIPVGDYQTMLVPVFALFLGGLTSSLSLVWRASRLAVLAVPILFLLIVFGIVFGFADASPAILLPGFSLPAPREAVIGLAGFLLGFGFLVWRTHEARGAALRFAARASGVRQRTGGGARRLRRGVLAGAVLLLAVGVAVPTMATVAQPVGRDVLRSAIDPAVELRDYVSPLSQYRSFFAADRYGTTQFSVAPSAAASADPVASRIRLAVLSYYDGQVFRVTDPAKDAAQQATAFARLPPAPSAADTSTATITISGYSGVWLPGTGALTSIRFAGENSQSLSDGYFYNPGTRAGVELEPLAAGDSYTVESTAASASVSLAALARPAAATGLIDASVIPQSLVDWVRAQKLGSDGAALSELVTRLRARGYLSHSLEAPAAGRTEPWVADLGDYAFESSLAGHSTGRIGALFTALLEKQNSTEATENDKLIAAVGDDEQFAVAVALLAEHLGFPARVVLGFALAADGTTALTEPACTDGACQGKNLAAWVEVQGAGDTWVTVDATPQHTHPLAQTDAATRDPQISTEVTRQDAREQLPAVANPTSGDERAASAQEAGQDLTWLFGILKTVGIVLLVLLVVLTPFLAILGAKVLRRRERRNAPELVARFAGGWDEYIDAAVDRGLRDQGSATRVEIAAEYNSAGGGLLADLADQAVFGPVLVQEHDSTEFWRLVDEERALLLHDQSVRTRLRAALSLRSFARVLGPRRIRTRLFSGNRLRLFRRDENRLEERPLTGGRTTHHDR